MGTRWAWLAVLWAGSICVSRWLVKQHYVLDTVGSVPFAIASYLVARAALPRSG